MSKSRIIKLVKDFPGTVPSDQVVDEIVALALETKRFGYSFIDKVLANWETNWGFASLVAETVKESRRTYKQISAKEARIQGILHITNSDGKRRARRNN